MATVHLVQISNQWPVQRSGRVHDPIPVERCILCGSNDFQTVLPVALPWVQECRDCGLQFAHPQPSDAELAEIYDADYFGTFGFGEDDEAYRELKQAGAERMLGLAQRHFAIGRLLDVGSALGDLLFAARRRGWEAIGVEPTAFAVQECEKLAPGRVVEGSIEDYWPEDGLFDVITCNDVLEHLRRPDAALRKFRRLLRPGGGLIVTTIDVHSLPARLLGRRWVHYHRDHLWYFSRRVLARLARAAGLEVIACERARKLYHLNYVLAILERSPNFSLLAQAARLARRSLPYTLRRNTFLLREGLLLVARVPGR